MFWPPVLSFYDHHILTQNMQKCAISRSFIFALCLPVRRFQMSLEWLTFVEKLATFVSIIYGTHPCPFTKND